MAEHPCANDMQNDLIHFFLLQESGHGSNVSTLFQLSSVFKKFYLF